VEDKKGRCEVVSFLLKLRPGSAENGGAVPSHSGDKNAVRLPRRERTKKQEHGRAGDGDTEVLRPLGTKEKKPTRPSVHEVRATTGDSGGGTPCN